MDIELSAERKGCRERREGKATLRARAHVPSRARYLLPTSTFCSSVASPEPPTTSSSPKLPSSSIAVSAIPPTSSSFPSFGYLLPPAFPLFPLVSSTLSLPSLSPLPSTSSLTPPTSLFLPLKNRGYSIGTRLIEDFLSRTTLPRCTDFSTQTSEILAKVGFKSFLNITPTIIQYPTTGSEGGGGGSEFGLVLDENPLSEMVELPVDALEGGLWFSQVLCGVVRGALEMVSLLGLLVSWGGERGTWESSVETRRGERRLTLRSVLSRSFRSNSKWKSSSYRMC